MSRIFSKFGALMIVLAFILIFIPMVTHADAPTGNIKFGDILYRPLPHPVTHNVIVDRSFHLTVPITPVNEISKVTMEVEGIKSDMNFMDMPLCGAACAGFLADVQLSPDSPIGVKNIVVTATDFNGHSATHTYNVTLIDPNFTSLLIPTNAENVKSDQPFDLVYKLDKVTQAVFGQDISISFDTSTIDFISAESLTDHLEILATKTDPYIINLRIIASSNLQKTDVNKDLIKLHFKAKPFDHQKITKVKLEKVIIADDKGNEGEITTQEIQIILGSADKTLLNNTIVIAQSVHDAATEGTTAGTYPVGSKTVFKAVIDKSQILSSNENSTQEQVDVAKTQLEEIITAFKNNINVTNPNPNSNPVPTPSGVKGDANNDSKVSVGDIGIVSSNVGKSTANSEWNIIKICDLNEDGMINIQDLIILAKIILGILWW